MNKGMIRALVLAGVFLVSTVVFSFLTNKTNPDMTTELEEATLPTVQLYYKEQKINELYGYVDEMNAVYMRDSITPIDTDRLLPIRVQNGSYAVDELSYEIRSMDTKRLIADAKVDSYSQKNGVITADLPIQNLLDSNAEYLLIIHLMHGDDTLNYYTRIIEPQDCYVKESIDFAKDFHEKTFQKDGSGSLATYMEPDSSADNTTLANVSIHSTLRQVTWDKFNGTVLTDPSVSIKEINNSYNVILLDYVVTATGDNGELEYYNVEEYYRVRYTNDRMYLLNFERTMDEIFRAENDDFYENYLQLGICSSDVEYKSNETGSILCFVKEGELWCYNATEKKLSQVFSFRGYEGIDSRENHKEHDIRIIKVDETGSADFVVYGYMNRGNHEGQVGVGVYHYDSVANTVEEELFIPSTHSYEVLKSELGQLMYENESGMFYIMMGGTLYEINLATTKEKEVVSGFETGNYAVSENNQFVAYIADGNSDSGSKITVLNLENSKSFEVAAAAGTYIRPLAFMEDDFIYGEADDSDVYTDSAGNVQFPMNHIYIVDTDDEEHGVLKDYHKDGYYVASVEVVDYTIYLNREQYNGMAYVPAEQDTIMNREGDSAEVVSIHSTVTERKQTQLQLQLLQEEEISSDRLLTPKRIVLESPRNVNLKEPEETDYYYAYSAGRVVLATDNAAKAIAVANDNVGVVVGSRQQYIWKRARKSSQSPLTITIGDVDASGTTIAKAINGMLSMQGLNVGVGELMTSGNTPKQILKDTLQDSVVIDLTGSDLDAVLYYVNLGTPVFAMSSGSEAVLITGYDNAGVYVYNPATGATEKMSMTDAQNVFDAAGNVYFAYMKMAE